MPIRLVIDTNVWLDWLVFGDTGIAPLESAVASGVAEICISDDCLNELVRVLGYDLGKWTQSKDQQAACLERCRLLSRWVDIPEPPPTPVMPRCSDPDDRMFLTLAWACGADYIVTKDDDLLSVRLRGTALDGLRIARPADVILERVD